MKEELSERVSRAWGVSVAETERLLATSYKTCVRVNTLNVRKSTLVSLKKQYGSLEKLTWLDDAYYVDTSKQRPSELTEFTNGEIIIQNPASFVPVLELQPKAEETILDMCAAPGGKSSHIAALTNNKASLTLNDTSRTRFFKMKKLMQTMGVIAEYNLRDGRFLSKQYGANSFNKILLDAPCSGEANMKFGDDGTWNMATIKRLNSLQTKLLHDAFRMLKPGGRLVYSTCTIAPEENEQVVDSLLRHNPAATILPAADYPVHKRMGLTKWNGKEFDVRLQQTMRLLPSPDAKPFYIAVITKTTAEEDDSYERLAKVFKI